MHESSEDFKFLPDPSTDLTVELAALEYLKIPIEL